MFTYPKKYDLIVVGAGHAGCEAALASARMGLQTLLLTLNLDHIAQMSCNPAIGGLGKGHIVREMDALGGEMGRIIDRTGIQFRMLNTKKGPAVWSPRAQADKKLYQFAMKELLEKTDRLDVKQGKVEKLLVEGGRFVGLTATPASRYLGKGCVVTTGTFLQGLIHVGENQLPGGRMGEGASSGLSESLKKLGFELLRFKTGTPPRVHSRGVDFKRLELQAGDPIPFPFSFSTVRIRQKQLPCYITYTNEKTHEIIRQNIHLSAMYAGRIKGIGPRYCPSIEDKVMRFPDRTRHQVFVEPEGRHTEEYYLNGLSTSLPPEVQVAYVRSIEGLENAEIMRFGYAVEYDYAPPSQLHPTLQTRLIPNLYFAGQINGTTGYEEAGCQGVMAGINAGLMLKGGRPLILSRSESYIGVLIDDLITKGAEEPYRMFTSRAEYRLLLRQDNADLRLMKHGHRVGLISDERFESCLEKRRMIREAIRHLRRTRAGKVTLEQMLRRPEVHIMDLPLDETLSSLSTEVKLQVEMAVKYEGYIQRELDSVRRLRRLERLEIPREFSYDRVIGLKKEAMEKLRRTQPTSLGQAAQIQGITPCDLSLLLVTLRGHRGKGLDVERLSC